MGLRPNGKQSPVSPSAWQVLILPQSKTSKEGVDIVSAATSLRESFQFVDVASPQNYLIQLKSRDEVAYAVGHLLTPFLLTEMP
jgi:hypothetical protein